MRTVLGMPWRDAASAAAILAIGTFAVIESLGYRLGELRNIGPGAFPLGIGVLLIVCAAVIVVEGRLNVHRAREEDEGGAQIRALVMICAALLSFVFLMPRFGAVPGIIACVGLSAYADGSLRFWQAALLGAAMAGFCAVVFTILLNLPLDLVKW